MFWWGAVDATASAGMAGCKVSAMDQPHEHNLTALIDEARAGSKGAKDRLLSAVYGEFHRIANALMRCERPGHALQPSDLVNEAVIRLLDGGAFKNAPNRQYLFGAAARAMRQALVDQKRKRDADKRSGKWKRVSLDEVLGYFEAQHLDVIALNEALDRLSAQNHRQAQVVELRFFAGMSVPEVAEVLGVSVGTVEGDWRFARAWLRIELGGVAG
jgi:RNA polymerase sigma factor (TIGR02999 family)